MSDLKPCPFCGGTDIRLDEEGSGFPSSNTAWQHCWCKTCRAQGPAVHTTKKSTEGKEAWNRRAPRFSQEERSILRYALGMVDRIEPSDMSHEESEAAYGLRMMVEESEGE